jgi:hypothetical protein
MTFSGPVNRHQADVIPYLVEENRVVKEQMKGRKLRLTDDQRRRLGAIPLSIGSSAGGPLREPLLGHDLQARVFPAL